MTIFSKRQVYHSLSLLFFIILVTACSSTRLIYSFTDKFIKDEINYFLYLDEKEKLQMNQQVSEMINWHRTSMMPSYASYLDNIADTLEMGEYDANKITIIIDEEEIKVNPHDIVVQRGTNHAWVNNGTEPALLIAVLIDSSLV